MRTHIYIKTHQHLLFAALLLLTFLRLRSSSLSRSRLLSSTRSLHLLLLLFLFRSGRRNRFRTKTLKKGKSRSRGFLSTLSCSWTERRRSTIGLCRNRSICGCIGLDNGPCTCVCLFVFKFVRTCSSTWVVSNIPFIVVWSPDSLSGVATPADS